MCIWIYNWFNSHSDIWKFSCYHAITYNTAGIGKRAGHWSLVIGNFDKSSPNPNPIMLGPLANPVFWALRLCQLPVVNRPVASNLPKPCTTHNLKKIFVMILILIIQKEELAHILIICKSYSCKIYLFLISALTEKVIWK